MGNRFARFLSVLFGAVLWASSLGTAFAFTPPPNFIGTTYEGCRNNGTITLPNASDQFICPNAAYTSGNLGKGWNELDLVPFRLITSSGNQAGPLTTYNIYIAADYRQGTLGYDFISVPTVNPVSDASCTVTAGPQIVVTGITGGTDETAYRELTITQLQGTTCRFDWYQRLALGASKFNGSNLQAYIFDQVNLSGGKRTIPIPVKEILPQKLAKDMSASQGSDHAWNLTKSANPANLSFGDVCKQDAPTNLPVKITVTWTKFAAVPGGQITVITNIYATNPAARTITTDVTDKIYSGTTLKDTAVSGPIDVPANTANFLILTHTYLAPAGTTDLNDIATATYTDKVTGIPIPGTTTATASANVQNTGGETNASASIADTESITGAGLTFSVATPALGAFQGGYVAGTPTTGPVVWGVMGQTASGSVDFNKTVYLGQLVTSGVLSDVATLAGVDGFAKTTPVLDINISSTSFSTLTINKSYSGLVLSAGEKLVFNFLVTRNGDPGYSVPVSITLPAGTTSGSTSLSDLLADMYVVDEKDTMFYPNGCNDPSCASKVDLQDPSGLQKTADLTTSAAGVPTCSGSVSFENRPIASAFPNAQVQKITIPNTSSGTWTFTLHYPDGTSTVVKDATANGGYVNFGVTLNQEGKYTVTEAEQTGWDLTSAIPNDGVNTKICSFTVNFPQDLTNKTYSCTFTNTERGKAKVIKTASGAPLSGTQSFTFELRQGASTLSDGTILETKTATAPTGTINFTTLLKAGDTYQLCELVMPGWNTSLGSYGTLFVPNSIIPPSLPNPEVNNVAVCVNFTAVAGTTKTFTVDNSPPPGGLARTIGFWKNWASCKKSSGKQAPVLDQTMAKAEPTGIQVDSFYLHGSTVSPDVAPDCAKAVNLLSKQNFSGQKKASDPLFNMTAQLVAAELNVTAGALTCPLVVNAISQANALLTKYGFNGTTYSPALTAADATLANSLATRLDDYNNDRPSACQP
jgi:hypothetical protein